MASSSAGDERSNPLLVAIGILLVAGGLLNWFVPDTFQPSVVEESSTSSTVVETVKPSVTRQRTPTNQRRPTTTVARSGKKTTITNPSDKRTETTAASGSRRSESVTIALLGAGLLCLFVGAPTPGIASITGPGGIGVTYRQALGSVSDVAALLEKRVGVLETNTERLGKTVELLVESLIRPPRGGGTS